MQDPQVQSWLADPALLQRAKAVAGQVTKRRAAGGGRVIKCMAGTVGTTDTWRQSPQAIDQIHSEAETLCEEMEAAAVAQVALATEVSHSERGSQAQPGRGKVDGGPRKQTEPILPNCPEAPPPDALKRLHHQETSPSPGGAYLRRPLPRNQGHRQQ